MEKFDKIIVSYQKNFWGEIINRPLIDILDEIKGCSHVEVTAALRKHYQSDDGLYTMKKKNLPVATFCANFREDLRKKEGLNQYNSIMIIDIDHIGNIALEKLFELLSKDRYIVALWISPSGNGIKGLVKIDYVFDFTKDDVDVLHYAAFVKISEYFQKTYDVILDKSGNDFTRLCFISHDPHLHQKSNEDSDLFIIKTEDRLDLLKKKPFVPRISKEYASTKIINNLLKNPQGKNNSSDKKMIVNIIKYLKKTNQSITFEYDDWLRVGLSIATSFTFDKGIEYYKELSMLDTGKYNEVNCTNMLKDCYVNNKRLIKFKTIIHLAVQKGFINKNNIGVEST